MNANLPDPKIHTVTTHDLPNVTAVHMRAFPGRAMTTLGAETVRRYYHWLLTGPHEAFFVKAQLADAVAGYCVGGKFYGVLGGFLQKNRAYLLRQIASRPWLLITNPLIRDRLLLALKVSFGWTNRPAAQAPATEKAPDFRILAIAVDPDFQQRGIGKQLMAAATKSALTADNIEIGLSVHLENEQAIRFYEGLGWQRLNDGPTWTGGMIKHLVPKPCPE